MTFPIPKAVLDHHTAFLGKTGSGKTSTSKLAVEQIVDDGFRVCVLDPIKSDWWGITSSADGKKPGLPFRILGGPHGHVPLHSGAGKAIGHLVGSGKLPLSIIDMADFEPGGLQRFFCDFAPALMRSAKGVIYLVIEEAHEFAPKERAGFGAENMAIHWAKKLATAGRSKGIRLLVATQSIQSLHNSVLGSCETVIAHRLTTPAHQEPVLKWLKANGDKDVQIKVTESLSSLPTGTAWVCSGEAKLFKQIAFPKFRTYDNTTTPSGDGSAVQVATAQVDPEELKAIIGDAVKEAEANDPKALRAEIARLKAESQKHIAAAPVGYSAEQVKEIQKKAWEEGHKSGHGEGYMAGALAGIQTFRETVAAIKVAMPKQETQPYEKPVPLSAPSVIPKSPSHAKPVPQLANLRQNTSSVELTSPQQKIIRSLLFWATMGNQQPTRAMVARIAGYSPTSGGFGNLLGSLKTLEVICYPSTGLVSVLPSAGYHETMLQDEAARILRDNLSAPQQKIVDALLSGNTMSREDVGAKTDYSPTSGGFGNLLGSLRTIDVISYPTKGMVALTDWAREVLE